MFQSSADGASDRPIGVIPSVLLADLARLGDEVVALDIAGADRIQWDVMDGNFVPNLTFGPDVIAASRPHTSLPFEALDCDVEVDGGIAPATVQGATAAGANMYKDPDGLEHAVSELRALALSTRQSPGE